MCDVVRQAVQEAEKICLLRKEKKNTKQTELLADTVPGQHAITIISHSPGPDVRMLFSVMLKVHNK